VTDAADARAGVVRVGAEAGPPAGEDQPRRYVYHCALRWSDLDAFGHINNARFLTLYEEARVALMFAGGRACGLGSFEDGVVISRHEIDYLRPVDYSTERGTAERAPMVRIEMWVEEMRASRFTVGYELFDSGVLASRARSVLVPFDVQRQRPRRLTEDERAFLRPYVQESPARRVGRPRERT
jgi:acyl-CoA thioester hydrolase